MKREDLQIGIIFLVVFILLFAESFTFQVSSFGEAHTSAAFFPRVVLLVAMGLTVIMMIQSVAGKKESGAREKLEGEKRKRVLGSVVLFLCFGLGASFVGTFVSLFLLIAATMFLWGVRKIHVILLNAALTPLAVYLVFAKVFMVQFPSGILF